MLQELKTLVATCDCCGYEQQYVSLKKEYPQEWGRATRSQYVSTRLENEKDNLCPHCVFRTNIEDWDKYAKSTLEIF